MDHQRGKFDSTQARNRQVDKADGGRSEIQVREPACKVY